MDGVGEWSTTTFGVGRGAAIDLTHEIRFRTRDPGTLVAYQRNLVRICRVARAYGARVVLAPQPEIFQRRGPIPAAEEKIRGRAPEAYAALARKRYPEFVRAAEAVAGAEGAAFCDCSHPFDGLAEGVFLDTVHVDDRGNERIAEHLAPTVARVIEAAGDR